MDHHIHQLFAFGFKLFLGHDRKPLFRIYAYAACLFIENKSCCAEEAFESTSA
jgi:hypothetical protein